MKVIIADDEYRICSLVKGLVHWNELGLECCGIYQNALAVLEHLQREPVDILICDIEMPGMTGLELIERISQQYSSVNCVIVSGYRNFEYAQKALKYGVSRYVLKPIDEDELNEALKEIVSAAEMTQKKIMTERAALIKDIADGVTLADLQSVNQKYNYNFKEGCFRAIKLMVPVNKSAVSSSGKIKNYMLSNLVTSLLMICYDFELYDISPNISFALLNYENNVEKIRSIDELMFNTIAKVCALTSERAFISVGEPVYSVDQLMVSLDSSESTSWQRFLKMNSAVLYPQNIQNIEGDKLTLTFEEKSSFAQVIENKDEEGIEKWVNNCFGQRTQLLDSYPKMYHTLSVSVLLLLYNTFYNLGYKQSLSISSQKEEDIILRNSMDKTELLENLTGIIKDEISKNFKTNTDKSIDYIQQATSYISKHFKEDISLEDVSEKLSLNYNYVCALFKEEVGVTYKQYLTQLRIDEAKRLLIDTNMTISQIAGEVGYRNAFYFTNLFIENTGLKPKEYRKLHRIMK